MKRSRALLTPTSAAGEAAKEIVRMVEDEREPFPAWSTQARKKYGAAASQIISRYLPAQQPEVERLREQVAHDKEEIVYASGLANQRANDVHHETQRAYRYKREAYRYKREADTLRAEVERLKGEVEQLTRELSEA